MTDPSRAEPHAADPDDADERSLERAAALSDGVFSIAATLLVIEVKLPEGHAPFSWTLLAGMAPRLLAYAISFLVIGQLWVAHHRKLKLLARLDGRALWLNLAFLMLVAFIPFPTAVISDHPTRDAVVFYALSMAITSALLAALWAWIGRHPGWFAHPDGWARHYRHQRARGHVLIAAFLVSIPIAYLDASLAMWSWLVLAPIGIWFARHRPPGASAP